MDQLQAIMTHTRTDGTSIKFDANQSQMTNCNGARIVHVDTGHLGLLELGFALIRIDSDHRKGE